MFASSTRKKATFEQKELITTFLSNHEGMRTRKFSAEMTYQKYQDLWNELTLQLNYIGPAKTVKDWQKYWNDQRSRVKRKAADIKQSLQKTGGGIDQHIEPLSIEDENILEIMGGNIVVCGDENVVEAGLEIPRKFDSNDVCEEYVGYTNIPSTITSEKVHNTTCSTTLAEQSKRPKIELLKTPTIKKKKRSDSPINREHLIQLQVENNDIQRDIAKSVKERNAIEERKIGLKEQKIAIEERKIGLKEQKIAVIEEKNKLEQKKNRFS